MRKGSSNLATLAGLVVLAVISLAPKPGASATDEFRATRTERIALEKAAAAGDSEAARILDRIFHPGPSVDQSSKSGEEALEMVVGFFRAASGSGDIGAMHVLGERLNQSGKSPQEVAEGAAWLLRCAEAEYAPCLPLMADAYRLGRGVEKDEAKALRLYQSHAAAEPHLAARSLREAGWLLARGFPGHPEDWAAALQLFLKAAELNDDLSMEVISFCHERGLGGLERSLDEALAWKKRAAEINAAFNRPGTQERIRKDIAALEAAISAAKASTIGAAGAYADTTAQGSSVSSSGQAAVAQSGVDPDLLTLLQGVWVSRFPRKEHSVEIRGVNVLVHVENPSEGPAPRGTVVAVITGVRAKKPIISEVDGRTLHSYEFDMRRWSNYGTGSKGGYRLADNSYGYNYLTVHTFQCKNRGGSLKPHSNYFTLSGFWGGDMVRQAQKDRWFPPNDTRPNWAEPIVPACP